MKRRGFTLIEILTTIFIFGVLVSITGYVYGTSLARSRDSQRLTDLNTIKNTLEQYYLENRVYPYNSSYSDSNYPRVAKYELEKYTQADGTCSNTASPYDPNKSFLAPNYITTLPEDPQRPMRLTANCDLDATGVSIAGYGQYLYGSQATSSTDSTPRSYNLAARLERDTHVSSSIPAIDARFTHNILLPSWGYTYCASEQVDDPTRSLCSHNYYLATSNND